MDKNRLEQIFNLTYEVDYMSRTNQYDKLYYILRNTTSDWDILKGLHNLAVKNCKSISEVIVLVNAFKNYTMYNRFFTTWDGCSKLELKAIGNMRSRGLLECIMLNKNIVHQFVWRELKK